MSYGTKDLLMYISKHCQLWARLWLVIQKDHEGVCKGCAQGKNTKKPYPNNDSKAKGILDIIHSDICGPMQTTSLSGYVYYTSSIDDYSHKT